MICVLAVIVFVIGVFVGYAWRWVDELRIGL